MRNWTPKSNIKSLLSQKLQQMQKVKKIVLFLLIAILSSCVPKRTLYTFKKIKSIMQNFRIVIKLSSSQMIYYR